MAKDTHFHPGADQLRFSADLDEATNLFKLRHQGKITKLPLQVDYHHLLKLDTKDKIRPLVKEVESSGNEFMENNKAQQESFSPNLQSFTVLHLFSIFIGLLGTGILISSEAQKENNLRHRTLYSLLFLSAGILFALRLPEKYAPKLTELCPQKNKLMPWETEAEEERSSQGVATETAETKRHTEEEIGSENTEKDTTAFPTQMTAANQETTPEKPDQKTTDVKKPVKSSLATATKSQLATYYTTLSLPYVFALLSCIVSIHNTADEVNQTGKNFSYTLDEKIKEGTDLTILYTLLATLIPGFLFNLAFVKESPPSLAKLYEWILYHRNVSFLAVEYFTGNLARSRPLIRAALTVPLAAFWSGFNYAEILKKAFTKTGPSVISELSELSSASSSPASLLVKCIPPATFLSGVGLMGASLAMLKEDPVRNAAALWIASIGGYMMGQPIGRPFGKCISPKYHKGSIRFLTYLLIFFANVTITSLDFFLLPLAGVCGGLVQSLLDINHNRDIALMQKTTTEIKEWLATAPHEVVTFLKNLDLEKDLLLKDMFLLEQRNKHRTMKMVFNSLCVLFVGVASIQAILGRDNQYTSGRVTSTAISMPLMLIFFNFFMSSLNPSKYTLNPLSYLQQFFFSDQLYALSTVQLKVAFSMSGLNNEVFVNNWAEVFNAWIFNGIVLPFVARTVYKHFMVGYKPYVPRTEDLEQLKMFLSSKDLKEYSDAAFENKLQLNYYLLQFVQENCLGKNSSTSSCLDRLRRLKSGSSALENLHTHSFQPATEETPADPPLPEKKSADASSCKSHHYSPHFFSSSLTKPVETTKKKFSGFLRKKSTPANVSSSPHFFLACSNCPSTVNVEVVCNNPKDAKYYNEATNTNLETTAFDAAIRGPVLRGQLNTAFELPGEIDILPATSYIPPTPSAT